MIDYKSLILEAIEARKMSYCPYSGFAVGAALLSADGKVFRGCNIENVAFTPTSCAERTAFFKAISEGTTNFKAIAVIAGKKELLMPLPDYISPCGVCRQVMIEFCDENFKVILAKSETDYKIYKLSEIMPLAFIQRSISKQ